MSITSKKLVTISLLTAFSLIAFIVESVFPPIIVPGAKMGVSNIFILISLIVFGPSEAFIITVIKCVLGSILVGNVGGIIYSLPAGIVSLIAEILLLYFKPIFSAVAVSVVGAVLNSTVQNITFAIITGDGDIIAYLPYLSIISAVSGIIVGLTAVLIIRYVPFRKLYTEKTPDIDPNNDILI